MIENKNISFKVKEEHKKAILDAISNNPTKILLYKGLNAIVRFKANLDYALGPELKEIVEKIITNLMLFDGPKVIFNKIKKEVF